MNNLPLQFQDFSVFAFTGKKRMLVEQTGSDFHDSINEFLGNLQSGNKPLKVALDLSVLDNDFLRSQELGRQIDRIKIEGRKHPEKKVEFAIVGSEFIQELNGMASLICQEFPVTDFEPRPRVGN